jgi:hypothetical protein
MTTIHHRSNVVVAFLAVILTVAARCDAEQGVRSPPAPAATEGSAAAQVTPAATPRESPPPVSGPAATVPIIDLHFHADRWDIPGLVTLFDELGVARAGNGTGGSDSTTRGYTEQYPDRFFSFAGQGPIGGLALGQSERTANLESQALLDYLAQLEADLQAGRFKGIGELYANNLLGGGRSRYPADSPLMQRLWALSATYQVPLSVHMDATEESVAEMERLLASDRRGSWIWAHTGMFAEPPLLRRLLQTHTNLVCELSARITGGEAPAAWPRDLIPMFDVVSIVDHDGRVRPAWRELLEEFPDRFMIGTDTPPTRSAYVRVTGVLRQFFAQLSTETAAKVAHGNAERLLRLSP